MDRKLRPHILHDLHCNLKVGTIPSLHLFLPHWCAVILHMWSRLTYKGTLKDAVLSWGPWIVVSWRNLLWICVVPNMMKSHQALQNSISFALFKTFACDFLWMIAIWIALSHSDVFGHVNIFSCLQWSVDICYVSLYLKTYTVLRCLEWYVLWFHGVIYWVCKFKASFQTVNLVDDLGVWQWMVAAVVHA